MQLAVFSGIKWMGMVTSIPTDFVWRKSRVHPLRRSSKSLVRVQVTGTSAQLPTNFYGVRSDRKQLSQ